MIKLNFKSEYFDFHFKNEYFIFLIPLLMISGNWMIGFLVTLTFFSFFLLNKYKENKIALDIPDLFIWLILLFWGFYITLKSPSVGVGSEFYIATIIVPFLIFVFFCNIQINRSLLKIFFNFLILSGVILSLASLLEFYLKDFSTKEKIGGLWHSYNLISAYFMILFMFNLSFIINREKGDKILFYIISILFLLLGIFLTQTRGVWLAMVISIALFIIKKPKIIIPAIIFIGIIIFLFYDTIQTRFLTVKYFGSDVSSLGRLQAWISSIILIKKNFLFGYGFDSYKYLRDQVFPFYFVPDLDHSHNTYLKAILEMGFIGFILYFYFIVKAFIYSLRFNKMNLSHVYKKYSDGFLLSFLALFIVFMFEPYFHVYGLTTYIIWVLVSIIFKFHQISITNS